MTNHELELLRELINTNCENIQHRIDELKRDNTKSHDCLFEKIDSLKRDVNGLNAFKNKVLGISSFIALFVASLVSYIFNKLK